MEIARFTHPLPMPGRRDQLALFKGLTRSLARDALAALQAVSGAGPLTREQAMKLSLVRHYLDYLVRACEGRA